MPINESNIADEIHAIVSKYANQASHGKDGFIERDFDINGSDPILMLEGVEQHFEIEFLDDLFYPKEFDRKILGVKFGSVTINHIDDFKISELIDLVERELD